MIDSPVSLALVTLFLLHGTALIMVLFERRTLRSKVIWTGVLCCVPLLGPIYFLLFRRDWDETSKSRTGTDK
jgi:hypothetical protein